jgi:hypothetical protein
MTKEEHQIIEHLAMQESAIASLYAAFGDAIPEMRDFWRNLVAEEKAHAAVVWKLAELCKTSDSMINTHAFNSQTIQTNIAYLNRQTEAVKANGITALRALSISLDTEKGLIDKEFFRVIKSDNPAIENELAAIQEHTKEHFSHIEQRIEQLRSGTAKTSILDASVRVISQLAQCERLLSELYGAYSRSIPDMQPFWKAISNCEMQHEALLEQLAEGIREGRAAVNTEHISEKGIALFQALAKDGIARAKSGSLSAKDAMATALSIESALIDGDFYRTVQSDAPEFRAIATRLESETNQHIDSIQQAMQGCK